MRIVWLTLSTLLLGLCACQNETPVEQAEPEEQVKEISFYTPDSIKIFGDLYEVDQQEAIILLFHQGGSNARGEYATIIPRLVAEGFNVLAIDQRVGGQIYGSYNRTLANTPTYSFGDEYGYCDAYNNLESTLDYAIASGFAGKKFLWGSSYSASLAIQLGDKRKEDVSGVLAFSAASGGSMQACLPDPYFSTLEVPLLFLRPPNELESENAQAQFALAAEHGHQTYAAEFGVHGSSMLVEERVGNEVEATWEAVLAFLNEIRGE